MGASRSRSTARACIAPGARAMASAASRSTRRRTRAADPARDRRAGSVAVRILDVGLGPPQRPPARPPKRAMLHRHTVGGAGMSENFGAGFDTHVVSNQPPPLENYNLY